MEGGGVESVGGVRAASPPGLWATDSKIRDFYPLIGEIQDFSAYFNIQDFMRGACAAVGVGGAGSSGTAETRGHRHAGRDNRLLTREVRRRRLRVPLFGVGRCRANPARIRQSRPDSGLVMSHYPCRNASTHFKLFPPRLLVVTELTVWVGLGSVG